MNWEIKLGSGGQLILTSMEICRDLAPLKLAIHRSQHLPCTMRENINLLLDVELNNSIFTLIIEKSSERTFYILY